MILLSIDLKKFGIRKANDGAEVAGIVPVDAPNIGFEKGDAIVSINGMAPRDLIDYQFFCADEYLELEVTTPGSTLVVLADTYYPGWKAYLDGARTEIHRVNGGLRGVITKPGPKTIQFRYQPFF